MRAHESIVDQPSHRRIDRVCRRVAVMPRLPIIRNRSLQKRGAFRFISDQPELRIHTKTSHHAAGNTGRLDQIVRRSRRHFRKDQRFSGPPRQQHGHAIEQLEAIHQEAILDRTLHGVTQRRDTARNTGNLLHGIDAGQRQRDQSVTHFMMRDDFPLMRVHQAVLFLQAGGDTLDRLREIGGRYQISAAPCRQQRCLVDQIREVGTRETGRERRDRLHRRVRRQFNFRAVDTQNIDAPFLVGTIDQHLTIEPPSAQQSRIEHLGPVGRRQQNDADFRIESVKFAQQLIEGLFLFVMSADARNGGAAGSAERIEFVDEE